MLWLHLGLQVVGLFLGLISSVFLVVNRSGGTFSINAYALVIILATVCYGSNVNLTKEKLAGMPSAVIATTTVTVAGMLAFLFAFLPNLSGFHVSSAHLMPLLSLTVLGVLGTALAQFLFVKLLSMTSSLFASSVTYTMPIVAIGWGLLDGEVFHLIYFVSIIGILVGVILIRKG